MTDFRDVLTDVAALEAVYGPPSDPVVAKDIDRLDQHCRDFIARSPFVALAAAGADGLVDVSPRGGPAGFVRVLDDHRLVIPDAAGNRRVELLHRIVSGGRVGLLFVIPGLAETLRIRGSAVVTADRDLLAGLETGGRDATLGIGVTVDAAFLHCAKAFMRSGLWNADTWSGRDGLATPARMLADHIAMADLDERAVQAVLDDDYVNGL